MREDRIEKQTVLRADRTRVWKAISDAKEFGSWFGVEFDGEFRAQTPLTGRIVPTKADPEIAKSQEPYAGAEFHIVVVSIEPERLFSFTWHPFAVDPSKDYSEETPTLVTFTLDDAPDGTLLRIVESGFGEIPAERRAKAFEMNSSGWAAQLQLIAKYLAM